VTARRLQLASIDCWAEAPLSRQQMGLFSPTLDAMISTDDPVRLFDEVWLRLGAGMPYTPARSPGYQSPQGRLTLLLFAGAEGRWLRILMRKITAKPQVPWAS
jgi:hypothetical protein